MRRVKGLLDRAVETRSALGESIPDGAEKELTPERTPGASCGNGASHALTQGTRCLSERTQKRGQIGLQLAANALSEYRCRPFGSNRNHQGVAVDDSRHDCRRQLGMVDDIHQNIALVRLPRDAAVQLLIGCDEDTGRAVEEGRGE